MKANEYNPSLPLACTGDTFLLGLCYGLVDPWREDHFQVIDFTVFPDGVFNDYGMDIVTEAVEDGWDHDNFFYYKRLGVNFLWTESLRSLIEFASLPLVPDPDMSRLVSDYLTSEKPQSPEAKYAKTQVLSGLGADADSSPMRLSSLWDVGSEILSTPVDRSFRSDSALGYSWPGITFNGSHLLADHKSLSKSGSMNALPIIDAMHNMGRTDFDNEFSASMLDDAVTKEFNKLLLDHGLFIHVWFDKYQWPRISRRFDFVHINDPIFDRLCFEAYGYRIGPNLKSRLEILKQHFFWQLVLRSLDISEVTKGVSDWIDLYHLNRLCDICGAEFNILRHKWWVYFGSNGAKNVCLDCPIVEYPAAKDMDDRVREFVESCKTPPPDGLSPIDIRLTANLDPPQMVEMIKSWSKMGGITHAKMTYGGSWFEVMVKSGALPDGTLVTRRGIRSIASDGHICSSGPERIIDDWLSEHSIPHEREPVYPYHPNHNPNGRKRADWLVEDTYIEYFGLHGNTEYDNRSQQKFLMARSNGLKLIPIYPTDMADIDAALSGLLASNGSV